MGISITKSPKRANAITHGGMFHADDVMATVILSKVIKNLCVCRNSEMNLKINKGTIVYDVGFGKYDHHQKGGNGSRPNGVPYAAVGLIWRDFGPEIVRKTCDPELVWNFIDRDLIQGIDYTDNGVTLNKDKNIKERNHPKSFSISKAISGFNPGWDSEEDSDTAFIRAVNFAEIIFDNFLEKAISKANAKELVDDLIEKSEKNVLILDQYVPWKEFVFTSKNPKAEDIKFVVYPSDRGGYNWECVQKGFYNSAYRKNVPETWKGLKNFELQRTTGIKTAKFCHPAGFIGGAETIEDAIALTQIAINTPS